MARGGDDATFLLKAKGFIGGFGSFVVLLEAEVGTAFVDISLRS